MVVGSHRVHKISGSGEILHQLLIFRAVVKNRYLANRFTVFYDRYAV